MRCAIVFYIVVTILVIVHSLPELCNIQEYGGTVAYCGKYYVKYTFDFIPPVFQNISHIDLNGQPLKQLPYNSFRNVSSQSSVSAISVRYCEISHVDADALLNLHNLTAIDLSYNDINHIETKLFSHTKQLEYIFMGYNKIEVLPRGLFENLTLLERVDLHHNRIRQVESYSFNNAPSLRIIDLGNNRIEFLDMLFKDRVERLSYLWLYDNPWKCNCELGPLYEFLTKINQLDQPGLECENPPALHGRDWSDASRDVFVCPSEDVTTAQDSGVILKLDKEQGINKDAEPVTKGKPDTSMEISDITQRSLIIDEKQVVAVEEEINSSEISELSSAKSDPKAEGSIRTPQEPVDDQIVTTTTEISFHNDEGADTNVQSHFNDLKWLPWTLFSVAIICLLGCAARYTFIRYRRRRVPSVRTTDQLAEETAELMYFQTAQQANC